MKNVRIAVVGPGNFARVCHIPGIRLHGAAQVVAICGRDAARAADFARQEGIEHSFSDLDALLKQDVCDAVAIVTPDDSHFDIAMKSLARGKHIICEKPLAMDAKQARIMAQAAEKAQVINMVAFTFRYTHALQTARRLISEGYIGRPFHVSMQVHWGSLAQAALTWRDRSSSSAGGIWADAGSHLFDAVAFLLNPVDEVYAQLRTMRREDGFEQPDTVDLANCLAKTQYSLAGINSDVSVSFQSSRLSCPRGPIHEMQVLGSKGSLGLPLTRGNNEYLSFLPASFDVWQDIPLAPEARTDEPAALGRMMRAFVEAIVQGAHDKKHDATFLDGLNAQLALDAGIKSAHSKRAEPVDYER